MLCSKGESSRVGATSPVMAAALREGQGGDKGGFPTRGAGQQPGAAHPLQSNSKSMAWTGISLWYEPGAAAALPPGCPFAAFSSLLLLLHCRVPPAPRWGHGLPQTACAGQGVPGSAWGAQTLGTGRAPGAVSSSSSDTWLQAKGCCSAPPAHERQVPSQGPPTCAAWLSITIFCCWATRVLGFQQGQTALLILLVFFHLFLVLLCWVTQGAKAKLAPRDTSSSSRSQAPPGSFGFPLSCRTVPPSSGRPP